MLRPALRNLCSAIAVGLSLHATAGVAADAPQRWVSVGGAVSEWVSVLGGEAKLVGVDTTSQHPPALTRLPSVGYQRQLSAEGVLSLQPDLLVGTDEMGPPPVLAQLRAAGVRVEQLSSQPDLDTLAHNLNQLGAWLGAEAQAAQVSDDYRARLTHLDDRVRRAQAGHAAPGVVLLVGHAGAKPLIAGKGTAGDWVVQHSGGRNLAEHQGYKAFSVESLAALDPEVIVVADRALGGEHAVQALLKENPGLAASRAAKAQRLVTLDPTLLVGGLGPRLPDALQHLADTFYPELQAAQP